MARKKYHHLGFDARCKIEVCLEMGFSVSAIAKNLEVSRSTIMRELRRNKGKGVYQAQRAEAFALQRRKKASSRAYKMNNKMIEEVEQKLKKYQWSPEQIAGEMKRSGKTFPSHESIYKHVWKDKKQGGDLYKNLRHCGKKYNKRVVKTAGRGVIPNRVDIDKRPAIVEEKSRIGDWELDTIVGKGHKGAIVSMVDRASKYTKLVLVKNLKAETVAGAIRTALRPIADKVLTLTSDNGREFAMHQALAASLGAQMYFAKPYHSWERGLNEHTNGLVRQYFPKKTSFDTLTQRDVKKVENLLNLRPRKVLQFKTPMETIDLDAFSSSLVALQI